VAWEWFYRLGSPKWFYEKSGRWLPWLGGLTFFLIVVGLVLGLAFAPMEEKQGNSFRIIYIHVPVSFLAMAGYVLMAICGAISLIWKMKLAEMVMKSAAPLGAALTFLALVSGAIWGKPTWGTYWVWDARITSMLLLFFLYLGGMALQVSFTNQQVAAKACAILALVGVVNVPIIYWSVYLWNSLHQKSTLNITSESTIDAAMFYPLLIMIIAMYGFYATVIMLYTRAEIVHRERHTQWVKALRGSKV